MSLQLLLHVKRISQNGQKYKSSVLSLCLILAQPITRRAWVVTQKVARCSTRVPSGTTSADGTWRQSCVARQYHCEIAQCPWQASANWSNRSRYWRDHCALQALSIGTILNTRNPIETCETKTLDTHTHARQKFYLYGIQFSIFFMINIMCRYFWASRCSWN